MRAIAELGFEAHVDRHRDPRGAPCAHSLPLLDARPRPGEVIAEVLGIVEIDADRADRRASRFDSDDIDAAFAELDARYLAGEAAAHAQRGRSSQQAYAAFNRHELPA